MAHWKKCPECGETNYYQKDMVQYFDCGFAGYDFSNKRERACKSKARRNAAASNAGTSPAPDAAVASYRLALLDAARVAEAIALDMEQAGESVEYAGRCRALAEQMRAFAGHARLAGGENVRFDDLSSGDKGGGTAVARVLRRWRPW